LPPPAPPSIRRLLLAWYRKHRRDLPWRRTADPYRIWLSEVMLQQTRAAAVIPYFERFLSRFPSVAALAGAAEAEVLTLWSGLGYYSRARNLHRAARAIHSSGAFPSTYDAIRALPGVGDYTAAAVSSIAFGLPHAVLDGNVLRLLGRLTMDPGAISSGRTRKRLGQIAAQLLPRANPGEFNQAMMELGATLCLPKSPQCLQCPLAEHCLARQSGRESEFPIRAARKSFSEVTSELFVVSRGDCILLWQRPGHSRRLAGFWELPGSEQLPAAPRGTRIGSFRHTIVQTNYHWDVWTSTAPADLAGFHWIAKSQLPGLPLSTVAKKALSLPGSPVPLK
jgi:A/G-specific adenine glycosylase